MEATFADAKKLKTLEDYAVALVFGTLSLKTLETFHIKAIEQGILTEDISCRANTIIWDLRRMMKLYQDQAEAVLELVPDDFNIKGIIDGLKKNELTKAKEMVKKSKPKKEKS